MQTKRKENLYKRGRYWWVKIELNGRKVNESTCETSVVKAREYRDEAREKLKKLRKGGREDISYDKAMEAFLNYCESTLKPQSVKRYEVSARAVHYNLTGKNVMDISKADIIDVLDIRLRTVSGSAVNRDRALLSSFFSFCSQRDYVEVNPVMTIKRQRENEPRIRNLTPKEFKIIHGECGKLLADMAEFNTLVGLRPSELVFLKHEAIDLDAPDGAELKIDSIMAKSRRSRIVPLPEKAVEIYTLQIRHIKSPYIFWHSEGLPYKNAPRAIVAAASSASKKALTKVTCGKEREEALKLADFEMHDLRRTFTCWEYRKGVKLETLSKLLGHSSYAVTEKHYWFLLNADLHNAIRGNAVTKSLHTQGTLAVNLSDNKARKGKK